MNVIPIRFERIGKLAVNRIVVKNRIQSDVRVDKILLNVFVPSTAHSRVSPLVRFLFS